jgi:flagellar protein FliL
MATPTTTQQAEATQPKFAKLKRIVPIALAAVVAAGAAAGGMYFYLLKHGPSKPPAPPPPVFFPLDPMTVNLLSDDGEHYLRVGLTLKVADEKMQTRITEHMPELRSRILLDLSNKHPEDLSTVEGKRALAEELKTVLDQPTESGGAPLQIEGVLFTEFVVQ